MVTTDSDLQGIRVCLAGTWDPGFHRNRILVRVLEEAGCELLTCQIDAWGERGEKIVAKGKLRLLLRLLVAYFRLAWRFTRIRGIDLVIVPYPGHFDIPLFWVMSRLKRCPLVFDIFISLYDTIVSDRQLARPTSLIGRSARAVDRLACWLADLTIADTPIDAAYFSALTGVPVDRFRVLWLGAQEDVFHPRPDVVPQRNRVLFHGTFIPLQGLETIVRAAKHLEADGITVRVIGAGQMDELVDRLVQNLDVKNLERVGLLPLAGIPAEIAAASVCLGIFGETDKARRVVPNKVFECLAVGRPVVTRESEAIRAAFAPEEIVQVRAGDPLALADAVRLLCADDAAREKVAAAGHARFQRSYSQRSLGRLAASYVAELVRRNNSPGRTGESSR